jgi:hypothetical protein
VGLAGLEPAASSLSEIDGGAPCYPTISQVVRFRKRYRDGVNCGSAASADTATASPAPPPGRARTPSFPRLVRGPHRWRVTLSNVACRTQRSKGLGGLAILESKILQHLLSVGSVTASTLQKCACGRCQLRMIRDGSTEFVYSSFENSSRCRIIGFIPI